MRIGGLPVSAELRSDRQSGGVFVGLPGTTEGLRVEGLRRFLSLQRNGLYWIEPHWGEADLSVIRDGQFLLAELDHGYGVLLPLIEGDSRCSLVGQGETLTVRWEGALPGQEPASLTALYWLTGDDPLTLCEQAVQEVAWHLKSFRMRWEKPQPDYLDLFGWCTWDAFYRDVTAEGVLQGLQTMKRAGVDLRFMLLDDGWLDVDGDFLLSFNAIASKFPEGLGGLIRRAKEEHGIEVFGLWHAFEGYWAGVHPESELAQRYRIIPTDGTIRPWNGPEKLPLGLIHPDDIARFYLDWHDHVRREGVDMVKVDGQSALETFTEGELGRVSTMKAYQQALSGSVHTHFQGNFVHCMCNGSDVAYNMLNTLVWRNSDDYFPKGEDRQQRHLVRNAFNSLWTSQFALPDWDMFWSLHPFATYHAASRAMSGGPVYVSDKPGEHDAALIASITWSDGRVLRCDRPALPAAEGLMTDPMTSETALKITNVAGGAGIVGVFNARVSGSVSAIVQPTDVPELDPGEFAMWSARDRALSHGVDAIERELGTGGWDVVTCSPVLEGLLAPIGHLEKIVPSVVFEQVEFDQGEFVLSLLDGGPIGFWARMSPRAVLVGTEPVEFAFEDGLLTVQVGARPELPLRIQF